MAAIDLALWDIKGKALRAPVYELLGGARRDAVRCYATHPLGTTRDGTPALLNRKFVESDVRIVTGFIEPHFFAGFSGGPKALMPGVAHVETVMSNHGAQHIGDPTATFGTVQHAIDDQLVFGDVVLFAEDRGFFRAAGTLHFG